MSGTARTFTACSSDVHRVLGSVLWRTRVASTCRLSCGVQHRAPLSNCPRNLSWPSPSPLHRREGRPVGPMAGSICLVTPAAYRTPPHFRAAVAARIFAPGPIERRSGSIAELLRQDALIEVVSRVEEHQELDVSGLGDFNAHDTANLDVVGHGADRALVCLTNGN